ncbi:hypothetical protein VWX96_17110 [Phaeobacter sp. A90a-4f]|uniref:DUF6941 family protein n=1 Tax=Phaeobacter TaxID=302485 RepID=UPI0021A406E6|nr:hypothetical protein [Phaeobacter inhibens]UWS05649.1 hypothetical protein K4K94_07990 [Phaeobacter inhibens]
MTYRADAIICEDIRVENNGKVFIIGMYTGAIAANAPTDISLTALLRFWNLPEGQHTIDVSVDLNEAEIMSAEGELNVGDQEQFSAIPLPQFHFTLKEDGELKIKAKLKDSKEFLTAATIPTQLVSA